MPEVTDIKARSILTEMEKSLGTIAGDTSKIKSFFETSMEEQVEGKRADKLKGKEEKTQTKLLQGILKNTKGGKGSGDSFFSKHWGKILMALLAAAAALKFPLKLLNAGPTDWAKYLLQSAKDNPKLAAAAGAYGLYKGARAGMGINKVRDHLAQNRAQKKMNKSLTKFEEARIKNVEQAAKHQERIKGRSDAIFKKDLKVSQAEAFKGQARQFGMKPTVKVTPRGFYAANPTTGALTIDKSLTPGTKGAVPQHQAFKKGTPRVVTPFASGSSGGINLTPAGERPIFGKAKTPSVVIHESSMSPRGQANVRVRPTPTAPNIESKVKIAQTKALKKAEKIIVRTAATEAKNVATIKAKSSKVVDSKLGKLGATAKVAAKATILGIALHEYFQSRWGRDIGVLPEWAGGGVYISEKIRESKDPKESAQRAASAVVAAQANLYQMGVAKPKEQFKEDIYKDGELAQQAWSPGTPDMRRPVTIKDVMKAGSEAVESAKAKAAQVVAGGKKFWSRYGVQNWFNANKEDSVLNKSDMQAMAVKIAKKESGGEVAAGRDPLKAENRYGFVGKYQMGAAALEDAGFIKPGTWGRAENFTTKNGKKVRVKGNKDLLAKNSNWVGGTDQDGNKLPGSLKEFMTSGKMQDMAMENYTFANRNALRKKIGQKDWNQLSKQAKGFLIGSAHLSGAGQTSIQYRADNFGDWTDANAVGSFQWGQATASAFGPVTPNRSGDTLQSQQLGGTGMSGGAVTGPPIVINEGDKIMSDSNNIIPATNGARNGKDPFITIHMEKEYGGR